jgi:4-hydroxy-tetrahydrodipicolinate synthase
MLYGCITALITPMTAEGKVDYSALNNLIEGQINSGVKGIVILGSTGEAAALSMVEKLEIIQYVVKINQKRVALIVGSGTAATAATLEYVYQVNQIAGIDYLMCLTPYYVKPTQEGLYQHFAAVATNSKAPVILYNVPSRSSCNLEDATILALARAFPHIHGLKDASADLNRCLNLLAQKPKNFQLYSGDDCSCLAFILCGGAGVIAVGSNLRPREYVALVNAALAGRRLEALSYHRYLLPLYELLFCETNPIPVKWGLYYEKQINSPSLRLPLTELSVKWQQDLAQCLDLLQGDINEESN